MVKEKDTITVDRVKLAEGRAVLGVTSASAAIDVALSEIIRRARLRRHVEAYTAIPETDDELAIGATPPDWTGLSDDTDWDAEWPEER